MATLTDAEKDYIRNATTCMAGVLKKVRKENRISEPDYIYALIQFENIERVIKDEFKKTTI